SLASFSLSRAVERFEVHRKRAKALHEPTEHRDFKRLVPRHVVHPAANRYGYPDRIGVGYVVRRDDAGPLSRNILDAVKLDLEQHSTQPPREGSQKIYHYAHADDRLW